MLFGSLGYAGRLIYYVARDSYVAPAILSPDSDLVISSKLKLGELTVEKTRAQAELEGIEAEVNATEMATGRLREVSRMGTDSIGWSGRLSSARMTTSSAELDTLAKKRALLEEMLAQQEKNAQRARSDYSARVITRVEYMREEQSLHELQVALLENQRVTVQSAHTRNEASLAHKGLAQTRRGPLPPELAATREQMIRVELELARLGAEVRAKSAQKRSLLERIARIDEISAQMKSRPLYQAVENKLNIAFVPYSQIDGVTSGATLFSCIWGIFACKEVGAVSELIPGEVILPDPWGNQARGQYAVLRLTDEQAARQKVLRVRSRTGGTPTLPSNTSPMVSQK
jgi:hypothetical protein